jgi:hypothetical protein
MYRIFISDYNARDIVNNSEYSTDDVIELLDMTFFNVVKKTYPNDKIDWSGSSNCLTTRPDKENVINTLQDIKSTVYKFWLEEKIRPGNVISASIIVFNDLFV